MISNGTAENAESKKRTLLTLRLLSQYRRPGIGSAALRYYNAALS